MLDFAAKKKREKDSVKLTRRFEKRGFWLRGLQKHQARHHRKLALAALIAPKPK
jgi:hypothetical protein